MNDKQIVERVKGQLYRKALGSVTGILPVAPPARHSAPTLPAKPAESLLREETEASALPHDALHILTLAQRTAEDHIAVANQRANEVEGVAQALAEQIDRDARACADKICAEADQLMVEARAAVERSSREAVVQAAEIRREAEAALSDARVEAERLVTEGREHAEQLNLRAQQRYEDAVGGLSVERESLQKQIEALSVFDAEYRQRLTSFLQSQLRTLWAGQPQACEAPDTAAEVPGGPVSSSEQG